jgi:uncharacterized protein
LKSNLIRLARYPAPVRILAFVGCLLVLWLPIVGLAYWFLSDQNTISILVISAVFVEFLGLVQVWGRQIYRIPNLLQRYGFVASRQAARELAEGLCIGLLGLFSLFAVQSSLGWVVWQLPAANVGRVVLEGLLISLGTALGEELIFRGWLLDELQQDYGFRASLWLDSLAFAALHYVKSFAEMIRTFPQFPGLLLLGITLVWAKRSTATSHLSGGQLSLPIGLHAGLVWGYYLVVVGDLIAYTDRVPTWITGIDRNPLAGGMGLLFLSTIAIYMKKRLQRSRQSASA